MAATGMVPWAGSAPAISAEPRVRSTPLGALQGCAGRGGGRAPSFRAFRRMQVQGRGCLLSASPPPLRGILRPCFLLRTELDPGVRLGPGRRVSQTCQWRTGAGSPSVSESVLEGAPFQLGLEDRGMDQRAALSIPWGP